MILEDQEEWACVSHYIDDYYQHSARRYAIGLKSEENYEGIYWWQYRDGSTEIPDYTVWASSHPRDEPCVSMEVDGGQWIDGDCYEDRGIFAICEKAPPVTTTTTTREPTSTKPDEVTTTDSWPEEWTDVCNYEDNSGDKCCSSGMRSQVTLNIENFTLDVRYRWLCRSEINPPHNLFKTSPY